MPRWKIFGSEEDVYCCVVFFLLPLQGRNPTSSRQWPTQHTMYNSTSPGFHLCKLPILLMEEILHRLRLVVYPIIYRVWYIPGGAGFLPSTVLVGKSIKLPWSWICFFGWFFFFGFYFWVNLVNHHFFTTIWKIFFETFFFQASNKQIQVVWGRCCGFLNCTFVPRPLEISSPPRWRSSNWQRRTKWKVRSWC